MRNFIKKSFYCFAMMCLFICMLYYPALSLNYASKGLTLWFGRMIPTLLPFMILSTLMVRLGLHTIVTGFVSPVLYPVFRMNRSCLYCIIIGFLCGFPMGAKVTAELYQKGSITGQEAEFLLSFNNNIGPIYFLSFVLPSLQLTNKAFFLFGMYGIPIIYGILLRYTVYRSKIPFQRTESPMQVSGNTGRAADNSLLQHLDDSIMDSLHAITGLGGYMVLFNLCNCIPVLLFSENIFLQSFSSCLLEISGGIQTTVNSTLSTVQMQTIILPLLTLGGISCFAQTGGILRNTDLSMRTYCLHKTLQYIIAVCFYFVLL